MDLSFLLRAERMLARSAAAAEIDHGVLLATLAAHQAASATARAAARCDGAGGWAGANEPLVELLCGGRRWQAARRARRGSFHRPSSAAGKGS